MSEKAQDLFGGAIRIPTAEDFARPLPRRKPTVKNGYAATPGTGPQGKKCGDCEHYRTVVGGTKTHPKCWLNKPQWTHGPGSDILKRSPACRLFADAAIDAAMAEGEG